MIDELLVAVDVDLHQREVVVGTAKGELLNQFSN